MAKRNELRSLLCGLDPGNARGREDIAFDDLIACDQIERFPLEPNLSACNGSSEATGGLVTPIWGFADGLPCDAPSCPTVKFEALGGMVISLARG